MRTYRDEAIVLRTHKLGEADRIITLLCRDHGKVRAVARGVRRTSCRFGGRLVPFSHVDVQLAVGRSTCCSRAPCGCSAGARATGPGRPR